MSQGPAERQSLEFSRDADTTGKKNSFFVLTPDKNLGGDSQSKEQRLLAEKQAAPGDQMKIDSQWPPEKHGEGTKDTGKQEYPQEVLNEPESATELRVSTGMPPGENVFAHHPSSKHKDIETPQLGGARALGQPLRQQ